MNNFKIFEYAEKYGYEQINFFHDKNTGLKAITAIHNTVLGPALGGSRFWNYKTEEEAVYDAMRLARGMTYKSSLAGLPLGGGKTVIWGDVEKVRRDPILSESFWRAFGRYLEGMNGRYITAEDVNTRTQDMVYINMETNHVVGLPGRSGNPSPVTAFGVYRSIQACMRYVFGSDEVSGKTIAVQGLGTVGYALCKRLHEGGANLIVTDINEEILNKAKEEFDAKVVGLDEIYSVECDLFAPCALGSIINKDTIPLLKAKIVCGAANNVLANQDEDGPALFSKGIVYAPDYLANAGGIINVYHEMSKDGYNKEASLRDVDFIYHRMLDILKKSEESGKLTYEVANKLAEDRIEAVMKINSIYTHKRAIV